MDAAAPLPPLKSDPVLEAAHHDWADVHAGAGAGDGLDRSPQGLRQRLSQLVGRAALAAQRPLQQEDRMLIGDLIRAADTLATRCDALSDRVVALEQSLAEVVEVLGADLTQLRADVAARREGGPSAVPTAGSPPHDG